MTTLSYSPFNRPTATAISSAEQVYVSASRDNTNGIDWDSFVQRVCEDFGFSLFHFPARYAWRFDMVVTRRAFHVEAVVLMQDTKMGSEKPASSGIVHVVSYTHSGDNGQRADASRMLETDLFERAIDILCEGDWNKIKTLENGYDTVIETAKVMFTNWYDYNLGTLLLSAGIKTLGTMISE